MVGVRGEPEGDDRVAASVRVRRTPMAAVSMPRAARYRTSTTEANP